MTDIQAVLAERAKTHGTFEVNAYIAQQIKAAMHDTPNWPTLSATHKEALEAVASKLARLLTGDPLYLDTVRDIIGYMQLLYRDIELEEGATDAKITRQVFNCGKWEDTGD